MKIPSRPPTRVKVQDYQSIATDASGLVDTTIKLWPAAFTDFGNFTDVYDLYTVNGYKITLLCYNANQNGLFALSGSMYDEASPTAHADWDNHLEQADAAVLYGPLRQRDGVHTYKVKNLNKETNKITEQDATGEDNTVIFYLNCRSTGLVSASLLAVIIEMDVTFQ